jgi:hypothetical protein
VRLRKLLVWLHAVTSVAWMSQALALFTLIVAGHGSLSAYSSAHLLDKNVLASLANASAFTGIMLSALTQWGFFRHWWVLVKFAITLSQLYLAIFFLSPSLDSSLEAVRHGRPPSSWQVWGALLMVGAIAFQAWVSIAKPWKRTPWSRTRSGKQGPAWLFVVALLVPPVDYGVGALAGSQPIPLFAMLTVIGVCAWQLRLAIRVPPSRVDGSGRVAGHRMGDARIGTAESSSSEPGTHATLG